MIKLQVFSMLDFFIKECLSEGDDGGQGGLPPCGFCRAGRGQRPHFFFVNHWFSRNLAHKIAANFSFSTLKIHYKTTKNPTENSQNLLRNPTENSNFLCAESAPISTIDSTFRLPKSLTPPLYRWLNQLNCFDVHRLSGLLSTNIGNRVF